MTLAIKNDMEMFGMVATLKEKNGKLYCSNCRMRVENLDENAICEFCG
jgi:Zn finger protein HypA/HybF involved in hydrogenase expression